ncbi:Holliday junction resolvase RuvX [Caldibacillus thermolactis]|jgi:putative holliday junction resolvase|uniref:Putative pre-16S rRNA nuclease n=1 Tax=Pallidibacillus thermolactis TaxID=251051 RepID=A0ABT2WBR9_9BACI|nr:Holliday junction resolvase RuvX [Pallidibacillus thermolactis]MCU9592925.1 Holliday junction resolvase RuvX [Pallidibacillus thermolactis]MCU9602755.1 Holliday junction resolvase RuvX [Pallidibacillus thermolactis subsp. kokeshiiformis]MED1672460.1 Holliday junction resolvase RuvX [Pallidibacillus thermolactis subsp. kokeshiiformis]
MRIMGLDVGSKTIGVAVSDAFGWTAQGIKTIKIDEENEQFGLDELKEIIDQYGIEKIVIGLPKNMNGTIGPRGEASIAFSERIKETFTLPVVLWDERLSTMAAERVLLEADVSRKKRKKVIDKMAAVMILQGYLDSQNH